MAAYTVKIENALGEMLQVYPSEDYILTEMTGITPADAVINAVEVAAMDGARFNTSRVMARNITITLKVRGTDTDVRRRRVNLYRYAKTKQKIRVYIANDQRDVYIDGYLESLQDAGSIFTEDQRLMMSVICPDPFFRDNGTGEQIIGFSSVTANFFFPFGIEIGEPVPLSVRASQTSKNIINGGDTTTGMTLTVKALGAVTDPVFYDENTGESMEFDINLSAGDELIISTVHGAKSAKLRRNGVTTNVINTLNPDSAWLELAPGDNVFYYTAASGSGNMDLTFSFINLFEGV